MNQINDKVHATLTSLVNGSLRSYLQDPIITMRGDRYCVPVKAEYRSQVQGLIHDQSATGSTLFIEPMSVVKLNNDLKELYAKEQEEIQVILARLSADAAEHTDAIRTDYSVLTELDFIFAKRFPCPVPERFHAPVQHRGQDPHPGGTSSAAGQKDGWFPSPSCWVEDFDPFDRGQVPTPAENRLLKRRSLYPDGPGRPSYPGPGPLRGLRSLTRYTQTSGTSRVLSRASVPSPLI